MASACAPPQRHSQGLKCQDGLMMLPHDAPTRCSHSVVSAPQSVPRSASCGGVRRSVRMRARYREACKRGRPHAARPRPCTGGCKHMRHSCAARAMGTATLACGMLRWRSRYLDKSRAIEHGDVTILHRTRRYHDVGSHNPSWMRSASSSDRAPQS